jgi:hypothetical protein
VLAVYVAAIESLPDILDQVAMALCRVGRCIGGAHSLRGEGLKRSKVEIELTLPNERASQRGTQTST